MLKKNFHIPLLTAAVALFITQACMQFKLAQEDGQTIDEAVHISAGYTYLTRGDFRFNPEHPPLVKYLSGIPLAIYHPQNPTSNINWESAGHFYLDAYYQASAFGHELLYTSGNNAQHLLLLSRIGPTILTLILGIIILLVGVYLWGWWAGVISYALYVFDPMITGHGHLVTTDIGASLGYLISILSLWLLYKKKEFTFGNNFWTFVWHCSINEVYTINAYSAYCWCFCIFNNKE